MLMLLELLPELLLELLLLLLYLSTSVLPSISIDEFYYNCPSSDLVLWSRRFYDLDVQLHWLEVLF